MSSSRDQTTLFHTPSFGDEDFVDLSSALPFVDSFDPVGAGALLAPAASHQLNFSNQDIDSVSSGDYFNQSYFSEYHQPVDHPLATAEFASPLAYPLINQTTSDFQPFQGIYQPQHATLAGAPHQSFAMESNLLSDESDDSFRRFSSSSDPSTFDQLKDPKKRKKRDTPNEPQKPVSAYALFFRDTQTAIKDQNPDTSFGEVSKIVSSMWDALDVEHKNVYKKKAENAKKEYLRQLAEYRAHAVSKGEDVSIHQSVAMQDGGIGENMMVSSRSSSIMMKGGGSQSPKGVIIQRMAGNSTLTSPRSDHMPGQMMQQNSLDGGIDHNSSSDQQAEMEREASGDGSAVLQKCIRTGCPNEAIVNPDWEDEYCSNECVIIHCRDVFSKWVQTNSLQQESY